MSDDDDDSLYFSENVDDHDPVLSSLEEAYETGRKTYDEGQAILEEVCSGDVIDEDIMGNETAQLKRAATQMHDD